ncbi:MAG: hypothetical protein ACU84Q_10315 [Gammaproteobacteria bacterium]
MSEDPTKLLKDDIDAVISFLHTERDELKVRMHLAKAEAKEEWEALEKKWAHFTSKTSQIGDVASDASKDVLAATEILAEELKQGYRRIKEAMKSES